MFSINFKSKWLTELVVFGLLFTVYMAINLGRSETDLTSIKNTSLEFDSTSIDLGTIKKMVPVNAEFQFTNTENNILLIFDVRPSCGCTNAQWTKEPVKKGARGKISVQYDALTVGRFSKSIDILSNNKNGIIVLNISGEVE